MRDDLKDLLEDASVGPRRPLDMPRALERARRSRRRRRFGTGALVLAFLIPAAVFAANLKEPRIPTPPQEGPSPTIHEDTEDSHGEAIAALSERMVSLQSKIARQHSRRARLQNQLARAIAASRTGQAAELRAALRALRTAMRELEAQLDSFRD
ncbi:MAG: hypothetical protein GEU71_12480, partial [Actinobacteria bacterium]|nr:hypothetical protein [Actinomycetota bacterium]